MQQRRAGGQRLLGVRDGAERLVGDVDRLQRVLGDVAALGQHRDDRLADEAHDVARQRMLGGGVIALHARGRAHRLDDPVEIGRGQHRDDARHGTGRRDVDVPDTRMRVIAAPERDMERVRHHAVVGERTLAGQ